MFAATVILMSALRTPTALLIYMVILGFFTLAIPISKMVGAVRKGEVLIWLSPMGIGQQAIVDADSILGIVLRHLVFWGEVVAAPSLVILYCGMLMPPRLPLAVGIFVLLLFPSYLVHLGRKPTPILRAKGIRPALLPWRSFGAIELEDLGGGSFELWARRINSIHIRKTDIIKIEFQATSIGAKQLFGLIHQWASTIIPVTIKPPDRTPGPRAARMAGLLIGRIIHRK
jgi:hypothetical protein